MLIEKSENWIADAVDALAGEANSYSKTGVNSPLQKSRNPRKGRKSIFAATPKNH